MSPMMIIVVYLSSRLGQVAGKGLFDVIRDHYRRWILYTTPWEFLIGNMFEAGADIGGMAAGLSVIVPVPIAWIVIPTTAVTRFATFATHARRLSFDKTWRRH